MNQAPNSMPIKNTTVGRKPIVDAILGAVYKREWLTAHPAQAKNLRANLDRDVGYTVRCLNQIAAGRTVKL